MEANESTLVPVRERVSFPVGMATYELFSQSAVAGPAQGGRVEAVADLAFTPFRVFVSLSKPIAKLRVEAPASVTLGAFFPVRITPLDADGKALNASVPIRLTALDAGGSNVWQMYGASFPTLDGRLAAPLSAAPGRWTIRVEELVSGRQAVTPIDVRAADRPPLARNVVELDTADVQRPELVKQFIAARKKDGDTVLILLDEQQYERRMDLAKEAAQALAALGVKTEIRRTDGPGVFAVGERVHLYQNWTEMNPAQYIDHHVLLLGGEGENVLIEELQENQLLARPLTAAYPGPGRGVVTLVRSPFAYRRDVLGLFGPDAGGMRAAIRRLSAIDGATPPAAAEEPVKIETRELAGEVHPGTPFTSMDGASALFAGVSAAGDRIVFTALGYATNLFVFDAAGKILLADKVGHLNTTGATPCGDALSK